MLVTVNLNWNKGTRKIQRRYAVGNRIFEPRDSMAEGSFISGYFSDIDIPGLNFLDGRTVEQYVKQVMERERTAYFQKGVDCVTTTWSDTKTYPTHFPV